MGDNGYALKVPCGHPYAVAEVIDHTNNEALVFPVASKWLSNIRAAFDDDGKYYTSAMIHYPADDDNLSDMLMKRPEPDDSDDWLQGSGIILKFCRTLGSAKDGTKKAEEESSLESDSGVLCRKRKRKAPMRYEPDDNEKKSRDNVGCGLPKSKRQDQGVGNKQSLNLLQRFADSKNSKESDGSSSTRRVDQKIDAISKTNNKESEEKTIEDETKTKEGETETIEGETKTKEVDTKTKEGETKIREEAKTTEEEAEKEKGGEESCETLDLTADTLDDLRSDGKDAEDITGKQGQGNGPGIIASPSPAKSSRSPSFSPRRGNDGNSRTLFTPQRSPLKFGFGSTTHVTSAIFAKEIKVVNQKLDDLTGMLTAVFVSTCPNAASSKETTRPNIPILPLNSKNDVDRLEDFVCEREENKLIMINVLADHGGGNLKDTVIGILKHLLSNQLATTYNMEGINRTSTSGGSSEKVGKIGFRSTFMYNIILAAVKKRIGRMKARGSNIPYDSKSCDVYMGSWLKDAPQRFKNERKRETKAAATNDWSRDEELLS